MGEILDLKSDQIEKEKFIHFRCDFIREVIQKHNFNNRFYIFV